MKKILFLLLLLPLMVSAQTYKYIGVEDGLSNRRVYYIQKDKKGYMWFLTHEGVDRYDGKEFKRYKLMDNGEELNSLLNLNWLYLDHEKCSVTTRYGMNSHLSTSYRKTWSKTAPLPSATASSTRITTSGCATMNIFIYTTPIRSKPCRSEMKLKKISLISNK